MEFMIKTERLTIQPFSAAFLAPYYKEFTAEITKYQYPDSFPDIHTADIVMSNFVKAMERGDMLELVILTHDSEFLGSMEAFDISGKTPELGLWLKSSAHGKGYGYEALKGLVDHLNATGQYLYYIYNVDIRNAASIHLAEKFNYKRAKPKQQPQNPEKYSIRKPIILPAKAAAARSVQTLPPFCYFTI